MMIEKYLDQTEDNTIAITNSSVPRDQMEIKHQQLKIIRYNELGTSKIFFQTAKIYRLASLFQFCVKKKD